jgi:hypothetical protein
MEECPEDFSLIRKELPVEIDVSSKGLGKFLTK